MGRHRTIDDAELLAVARRVFAEQGHAATTRDVARAAGISQSVLYQRFPTKDDLFFAAMLPEPPDLPALLGDVAVHLSDGRAYLRAVVGRILAYFEHSTPAFLHLVTHPGFTAATVAGIHERVLVSELIAGLAEQLAAMSRDGALAPVDASAAAETLVSALHSIAMFSVIQAHGIAERHEAQLERVGDVLWQGLMPRMTTAPASANATPTN